MRKLSISILLGFLILFIGLGQQAEAQHLEYHPKILLVTAHPDDDALFAATVFKTTHLLDGKVDLALLTNGEGGYKYSTLGNYIYDRALDKEEVGREYLPAIRKRELMEGGKIVGLRNYFFFDQVDDKYSKDISNPLDTWNINWIKQRLHKILREQHYDFVFTMMPSKDTHAHHKASAILALQAIHKLPQEDRPVVLAADIVSSVDDSTGYSKLDGYPISKINKTQGPLLFDRTQTFGHDDRLSYKIIGNWVIAAHKSQGTMQMYMGRGNVEQYWPYSFNTPQQVQKARAFFKAVNEVPIYRNPDIDFDNE
ncbi:PIG-L family deacetylase [Fodinibius halophilus]|uniref:PIG-L family deacetylase n=1 Tax=Fodinibius halophilus TaxID=1736908 RepID=A0A6M1T2C2_9BACT|nr:PIG-L family deacetylase [Fodinibius halophilus]NGP88159.1 PIG-L family deacetylase [Fodinibius halophilus]